MILKKLMIFIFPFLFIILINGVSQDAVSFYFPAEFERQEAVWLAWSSEKYRAGESTEAVIIDIIRELQPYTKVSLIVRDDNEKKAVKEILSKNGIADNHVRYFLIKDYNRWMRDAGPVFVTDKGSSGVIGFEFNFYGQYENDDPDCIKVKKAVKEIARELGFLYIGADIASEGGNREFNGKGAMLAVKSVEMQRNPDKSLKEIENEFMKLLGVKKIIWLNKGLLADDSYYNGPIFDDIYTSTITDGHIDEFCRFVSADTILLSEVTAEERKKNYIYEMSYKKLEENYNILKKASDQDGKPFKIIRVPIAENLFFKFESNSVLFRNNDEDKPGIQTVNYIIAASYLNFLITNGTVLMPKYWKPGRSEIIKQKDQKAKEILQSVFPDRKIIQIDAESLNHGGGGIHCITQQQAAVK